MGIIIEIVKELNIEVSNPNVFQAVVAKQYDMNTRFIKATFVDNGDKIFIDPEATVKVVINALRPDGESKAFDGEVNQDGTVTVPLHSWMLELVGTVTCDISVIDTEANDSKKLTTTSFTLLVEKAAYGGDDVTSDPQYDVLVQLLETCNEAGAVAEEALQKSNEAVEIAESVKGIYCGTGEMPEGYNVQIDDSGAVFEMDTKLNANSQNPVTNSAITNAVNALAERTCTHEITYTTRVGDNADEPVYPICSWFVRKWEDGTAELFGTAPNVYYGTTYSTKYNVPALVDTPFFASISCTTNEGQYTTIAMNSVANETVDFCVTYSGEELTVWVSANIHIIGRWKN